MGNCLACHHVPHYESWTYAKKIISLQCPSPIGSCNQVPICTIYYYFAHLSQWLYSPGQHIWQVSESRLAIGAWLDVGPTLSLAPTCVPERHDPPFAPVDNLLPSLNQLRICINLLLLNQHSFIPKSYICIYYCISLRVENKKLYHNPQCTRHYLTLYSYNPVL